MPALTAEQKKLKARNELTKKAEKLGIELTPEMSDEDVQKLVDEKEAESKNPTPPTPPEETKPLENPKPQVTPAEKPVVKASIVLKDTYGNDVNPDDYFFTSANDKFNNVESAYFKNFNKSCGFPVDREDLLEAFNRVFKKKGFLFYKDRMKEVYIVIVPLKYAKTIGVSSDSGSGDFQRHAMSFLGEGSAMPDTLRQRLEKIAGNAFIGKEEE